MGAQPLLRHDSQINHWLNAEGTYVELCRPGTATCKKILTLKLSNKGGGEQKPAPSKHITLPHLQQHNHFAQSTQDYLPN